MAPPVRASINGSLPPSPTDAGIQLLGRGPFRGGHGWGADLPVETEVIWPTKP